MEAELGGEATIEGIRRGNASLPVTATCQLEAGDEVAVSGLRATLAGAARVIGPELGDPADVDFIVETRDVVLTRRAMHRTDVGADRRVPAQLPIAAASTSPGSSAWSAACRHCPGPKCRTRRRAAAVRQAGGCRAGRAPCSAKPRSPSNVTDFVYLGGGLVLGILIGLVTVPLAGVPLSLGSAGALLSGLGFGWLRSRRPTFGRFPPAASQILKDLGLSVYIASIGLTSATERAGAAESRGWELPVAAIFVSLVPTVASVYIGRYLLHMEPAILCGAIAGQQASTPAIKATEAAAGNSVPVIGYTVTYAIANVLLPLLGPLFVAAFAAMTMRTGAQ